jgi:hypothetical protein
MQAKDMAREQQATEPSEEADPAALLLQQCATSLET